jgi:DNA-binding beta-propeller fold protein YncE
MRLVMQLGTWAAIAAVAAPAFAQEVEYRAFVASEAVDRISEIRFDGRTVTVTRSFDVGLNPVDPDGPHGLGLSPDGRWLFVTTAHGTPFGRLWKLDRVTGRAVAATELGNFPASLQVTPDGAYVFLVNFNLHGDMVPSSVSVVDAAAMVEVARITTCTMPHGSRLNGAGTLHYSACMMDDQLVELDARVWEVSRRFVLSPGREQAVAAATGAPAPDRHSGHGASTITPPACSPTWAAPTADGSRVFVACNRANDIVEIDVPSWRLVRRLPAGEGVYNLALTRDGRLLVATNKRGQSVSLFDTATGREVARLATRRRIVHGVAITPDDRYAFISVEGVGSEPGTVEVVDLAARRVVAAADVGQMAGGIDVAPR